MSQESESVEEGDTGSQEEQGERTQCETSTTVNTPAFPVGAEDVNYIHTHTCHMRISAEAHVHCGLTISIYVCTFLFVVCRS